MIRWAKHSRVKCDCEHYPKDHFAREGSCDECDCSRYYPNRGYLARKRAEKRKKLNERKIKCQQSCLNMKLQKFDNSITNLEVGDKR